MRSPWDLEMANLGYKVIEYDASIEQSPYTHENISFHKLFINASKDEQSITLKDAIEQNKLDEKAHNILQIDIEYAEWEVLKHTDMNLLNQYFSQVIFEFHGLNPEENDAVSEKLEILHKLNENFASIHFHFNNHGKIWYSKGLFFSTTIEVSYVRKDLLEAQFGKNLALRKNGILKGLDYPVDVAVPEIPVLFE
ncbi:MULTISPECIES: FkbM family methyltransferase [unclassified Campylobacter]|uniref:FkbM family methyltransferase n=1 Tax=unclassified Campylobacter TaxID=2593542 RepID=UPI001EE47C44|nr:MULTISPECIES: FkbM family methyltransferase [unclassified Campylobacter]